MNLDDEKPAAKVSKQIRLISPTGDRIYPNALTGRFQPGAGTVFHHQRRGLAHGEADAHTLKALNGAGWKLYSGSAVTDDHGWVVPGSDPKLANGGAGRASTQQND